MPMLALVQLAWKERPGGVVPFLRPFQASPAPGSPFATEVNPGAFPVRYVLVGMITGGWGWGRLVPAGQVDENHIPFRGGHRESERVEGREMDPTHGHLFSDRELGIGFRAARPSG